MGMPDAQIMPRHPIVLPGRWGALHRRGRCPQRPARVRPDVTHAHFGPSGVQAYRQCELLRIPLVVSFYGYDVGILPRSSKVASRDRAMFPTLAAVTAEGPALARCLIELGARPDFATPLDQPRQLGRARRLATRLSVQSTGRGIVASTQPDPSGSLGANSRLAKTHPLVGPKRRLGDSFPGEAFQGTYPDGSA
jgi:hypothetical protein